MRKSFWVPITLALAAYLVLPLPGQSAPLSEAHRREARRRSRRRSSRRACSPPRSRATRTASRASRARSRPPSSRLGRVQTTSTTQKDELLEVRDRLEVARDRLERLRSRAGHRAQGAGRPARGDLQGGRARRPHRGARGRRLRRPARARRVPRPHLRPGPPDHRPRARAARPAPRTRRTSSRASSAASSWPRSASSASATRSPRRRSSSCRRARSCAAARNDRARRARPGAREPATSSRATCARSRPRRRGWQRPCRAPASGNDRSRGPIKQGSGQLIWPVNGPVVSPLRDALGPPARGPRHRGARRHADPRRRLRPRRAMGRVGGYGNYTCVQHTSSLSTCYAHQSSFGTSNGAAVQPGPGDRLRGLHRPLLRGPPALRDPHQRVAGGPDGLPLARARLVAPEAAQPLHAAVAVARRRRARRPDRVRPAALRRTRCGTGASCA